MRILGLCNPQSGGKPERLRLLKHFAHSVTGASVQMTVAASDSMEQAESLLLLVAHSSSVPEAALSLPTET